MKRLFSMGLTLLLVLSMGMVALAGGQGSEGDKDWKKVKIKKELEIVNDGTLNPEETFDFTVGDGEVLEGNAQTAPDFALDEFTIAVVEGGTTGFANISLPDFTQVGVYTYPINEIAGDTAGMRYDNGDYNLVVTVLNDGKGGFKRVLTLTEGNDVKTDAFQNEFSAGDLVITKEITGNYAVNTDEFDVTVTLTPDEGKNIKEGPIEVSGVAGLVTKNENGKVTITFSVTDGSVVTIENIPYDVTYLVTEDSGEYTATITDNDAGRIDAASQSVDINNHLDTEVQTGVNLNSLPYFLVLGLAGAGLIGFTVRRRFTTND